MNKILDKMAYGPTVFLGAVFFLMPFLPEPHLVEKAKILMNGETLGFKTWLDIFLHLLAGFVALTKHLRHRELAALGVIAEGDRNAEAAQKHDQRPDES